jgi:hypothetical protein
MENRQKHLQQDGFMSLDFEPISLDFTSRYRQRLEACPEKTSDYSFSNIFGWSEEYELEWAWQPPLVWIRQHKPASRLWAPVGPWHEVDWSKALDRFEAGTVFTRVPETLARTWQQHARSDIGLTEERDQWDYVYDVGELVELKGNRFHKKKNLLNQFLRNYDWHYLDFSAKTIEPAMAMQADWCNWKDCESSEVLSAENRAVFKILSFWDQLDGLNGGVLMDEDMIVAYTIGETLTDDMVLVHFEKGCPDYKGVYQAINQMYLAHLPPRFRWVNREQDLGDKGLRKAKLSYNPARFLKKYQVTIR